MINRKIISQIIPWIDRKEILLLTGARQVGKTTLLKLIQNHIQQQKTASKCYWFDLENLDYVEEFNNSPENIFHYIPKVSSKTIFVFIDEIQYLDNPSNFLKYLQDTFNHIKFIVSGSSQLEIKAKLQDSLVGRIMIFPIFPLCFKEFLTFKNLSFPVSPSISQKKSLQNLLSEYLLFGGMPDVVLADTYDIKKQLLQNYTKFYINKDIRSITKIENISSFNNLIKTCASQIGNLTNITEIAKKTQLSFKSAKRYIDILQYTYIISKISPFHSNIQSQIRKTPKIYFYDIGIRNSILNNFTEIEFRLDNGSLFENFIHNELQHNLGKENIYFYRNKQKSEIDFIIDSEIKYTFEVKYKNFSNFKYEKVFENFQQYNNFLINLNYSKKEKLFSYLDWWSFINGKYNNL